VCKQLVKNRACGHTTQVSRLATCTAQPNKLATCTTQPTTRHAIPPSSSQHRMQNTWCAPLPIHTHAHMFTNSAMFVATLTHAPPPTAQSHNARLIGTVCVFQSSADPGLRRMITQLWRYDLGSTYEIDRCEKNALIAPPPLPPPLPLSPPLYRHCHYHFHHHCHHHHHSRRNRFLCSRVSGVSVRVCINLAGASPFTFLCL
jgi:hypothetical protein